MSSQIFLGIFFIAAGSLHFLKPDLYLKIIPPWIPFPLFMVYLSGFLEALFGGMVFFKPTRKISGLGLMALLAAVFPANIHLAMHPEIFPNIPAWLFGARLPFQVVFMAWVWRVCLV